MEDNKDVVEQTTEKTQVEQETTQKTYTQEDIDNSFNAGVRKANSDWQKDPKYKEFQEWKKTNQNDSDKINELQSSNNTLASENEYLKVYIKVSESDAKKEFLKFVTSEIIAQVDETTDLETALTNYKKDYPQYFGEVQLKKVQTSPNLNGGEQQPQNTSSIMNNLIRGAKN